MAPAREALEGRIWVEAEAHRRPLSGVPAAAGRGLHRIGKAASYHAAPIHSPVMLATTYAARFLLATAVSAFVLFPSYRNQPALLWRYLHLMAPLMAGIHFRADPIAVVPTLFYN